MTDFRIGDKVWVFEFVGNCSAINLNDIYLCEVEIIEIKPGIAEILQYNLMDLVYGDKIWAFDANLYSTKVEAIDALKERFNLKNGTTNA